MMRTLSKDHREKKRGFISVPVRYTDLSRMPDEKEDATGEGTTADLSNKGLGLFSCKELDPGDVVEIECNYLWASPRQFTVKWCNRLKYDFFRLGLAEREEDKEPKSHPG